MQTFNTDKEIKEYIEKNIDSIKLLDECRLYKEEQLQITEEVMRIRNSIEWIIRINKVKPIRRNGKLTNVCFLFGGCGV